MAYIEPTLEEFKAQFFRDFPFSLSGDPTDLENVLDQDIINAQADASFDLNQNLFSSQANYVLAKNLLTAHFLVTNIRNSSAGMNGKYSWLEASKGVANVSQGFSIPQTILDNPRFAMLTKTTYGAKFLELIVPMLVGNFMSVCGRTSL